MEILKEVREVKFNDDGVLTMETASGLHTATWNGSQWVHSFADGETGVFIGALDPAKYGGAEGVQAVLSGAAPFPPPVSPVGDVWFDLANLKKLGVNEALDTMLRVELNSLTALAQVLWEALAMCSLANSSEKKEAPNPVAMVPWNQLDGNVKNNYIAGALEMLKFLSSVAGINKLDISEDVPVPPWRAHFPLTNPAPAGYEAHFLHSIVSATLPRA